MSIKKITIIGSALGIASAFLGSILFLLVETVRRSIMCCAISPKGTILAFLFLCFVTLFPSMFGGMWLASMIYKDCQKRLNDLASTAKKGMFIGVASSVVSNFFVLILTNGRGGANAYTLYLFETTLIGALLGVATGLILKSIFLRDARYF